MPSYEVTLLPRQHRFLASTKQSILRAGLESGLNLKYGCEDGNCGKCLARRLSGDIQQLCHTDFVLTAAQKQQDYFLTCCHSAVSDLQLEMAEIAEAGEIPEQQIEARVYKLKPLAENVMSLTLKTPRSEQLSFLAGQYISLYLRPDLGSNQSIASCPCDGLRPEIHVTHRADDPFSDFVFNQLKKNDPVAIRGPRGDFILDDDTSRDLVFIAQDSDFASINSLLEHLIALDKPQPIRLYWLLSPGQRAYLENYCRSISHALDNFSYQLLPVSGDSEEDVSRALERVFAQEPAIANCDIYMALSPAFSTLAEMCRAQRGGDPRHWHIDVLPTLTGLDPGIL